MQISYAEEVDIDLLIEYYKHISKEEVENSICLHRLYIAEENGNFAGWMRYNLFWDNTLFMNLLYILEEYRGNGFDRQIVTFWETEMVRQRFKTVMTSTQSNEYAQYFYFKLEYEAIGGFRLPDDAYGVIFTKGMTGQ